MNHAENLFEAYRRAQCPGAQDEQLKQLKLAFLQGMHSGRSCVVQALSLDDVGTVKFIRDFGAQIEASLAQLGHRPGKVTVFGMPGNGPSVKAYINGEPI